jgi:hypothetical protein
MAFGSGYFLFGFAILPVKASSNAGTGSDFLTGVQLQTIAMRVVMSLKIQFSSKVHLQMLDALGFLSGAL